MGLPKFTASLAVSTLLLFGAHAQAQGAMLNPCDEYQGYVQSGNAESLMAQSFQKVCDTVGSVELTNDCMTYYSFVNSFGADSPMTNARAEACDASMPGLRDRVAAGPVQGTTSDDMASDDMANDNAMASNDEDMTDEPAMSDPDDGAMADQVTDQVMGQDDGQEPEYDPNNTDAEMAFWDSVKNSESPDMLQAYLTVYPEGLFAPIAHIRMRTLLEATAEPTQPMTTEPVELAEPVQEPVQEVENAATELAFWSSVKDSEAPEMIQTYLDAYPDGTFAPVARVMIDRLQRDALEMMEAQQQEQQAEDDKATQKANKKPKTARAFMAKAEKILNKADPDDPADMKKAAKRARRNYKKAADLGHTGAMMKLAEMHLDGLGGAKDADKAVNFYLMAARKGNMDGYEKALIVLDETSKSVRMVKVLVEFYKKRPKRAVDLLNTLSDKAIIAVQRKLKKSGYYFAALDADFGPQSERSLNLFAKGAPKPKAPQVVIKKYNPKVTIYKSSPLAAKLQRQLKRIWCYRGPIDGVWGPGSINAMNNFNRWWGGRYPIRHPSVAAYNRVRTIRRPVCGVQ